MSKLRPILLAAAVVVLASLPGERLRAKKTGGGGSTTVVVSPTPPSWSQSLSGSGRFKSVLASAANLDNETGLVWETAPGGSGVWTDALEVCNGLALGNRMGWRLPTVQELASLLDQDAFIGGSPLALPSGHPF